MKKIGLTVILAALILVGCAKKADHTSNQDIATSNDTVKDASTTQNLLDWEGTYKGILPAADAPGIDMTIILYPDSTFSQTYFFIDKKVKPVTSSGKFTWNADRDIITLESLTPPEQYLISEGRITHLDAEGNLFTGEVAKRQILTKVTQ